MLVKIVTVIALISSLSCGLLALAVPEPPHDPGDALAMIARAGILSWMWGVPADPPGPCPHLGHACGNTGRMMGDPGPWPGSLATAALESLALSIHTGHILDLVGAMTEHPGRT